MTSSVRETRQSDSIDPKWFRQVLGQYPTGVCVITAVDPGGGHAGMAVGSFTSVSLDPPLVAFFPDKSSTTWPRIERAGSFCVNVLAADQEHVCRAFAVKGGDKFSDLRWRAAGSGSPIIEDAIAWIDCEIEQVHEAGDHYIVVGRVRELDVVNPSLPLLFFQGGYGRFVPESLVTGDLDLIGHFRHLDHIRHELEELGRIAGVECNAAVRIRDELVIVATAGQPRGANPPTRVGHRYAMVPPVGCLHLAWASDDAVAAWLKRVAPPLEPDERARWLTELAWIREHGYSLMLGRFGEEVRDADAGATSPYDVHRHVHDMRLALDPADLATGSSDRWGLLSAPAFDPAGRVSLAINLYGFDEHITPADGAALAQQLRGLSGRITDLIGGQMPASAGV